MAGERPQPRKSDESAPKQCDRGDRGRPPRGTPEDSAGASDARLIVVAVVLIPALVGVKIGAVSREPADDFYATSAQVIATLFLAITVGFFARQAAGRGMQDAVVALVLAGQSWIGFFACVRALTGAATDLTRGLTGMGVTAASVLLSLALYDGMLARDDISQRGKSVGAGIILIVLFAAVLLLIWPASSSTAVRPF